MPRTKRSGRTTAHGITHTQAPSDLLSGGAPPMPFSKESELSLVGSMIINPQIIPEVQAELPTEGLYQEHNQIVYDAIKELYDRDPNFDSVVLKDHLGGDFEKIGGMATYGHYLDVPNPGNWRSYLSQVLQKFQLREALTIAGEIYEAVRSETTESCEQLGVLGERLKNQRDVQHLKSMAEVIKDRKSTLTESRKKGREFNSPFPQLDQLTGGFQRRKLYVVGAKTSHGKTTIMNNISVECLNQSKKVLIVSMENPDEVPYKLLSINRGIPLRHFMQPDVPGEGVFQKTLSALDSLGDWDGLLHVISGCSMSKIRVYCERFRPDVVMLDYLQSHANQYGDPKANEHVRMSKTAHDFHKMAVEMNFVALLGSQIRRRGEEQKLARPTNEDLKGSGDIENVADTIFLAYWPWQVDKDSKVSQNLYELQISKQRSGPTSGWKQFTVDIETLKIIDPEKILPGCSGIKPPTERILEDGQQDGNETARIQGEGRASGLRPGEDHVDAINTTA